MVLDYFTIIYVLLFFVTIGVAVDLALTVSIYFDCKKEG